MRGEQLSWAGTPVPYVTLWSSETYTHVAPDKNAGGQDAIFSGGGRGIVAGNAASLLAIRFGCSSKRTSSADKQPSVDGEVELRGKSSAMLAVCAGMYPAGLTEAQVAMQSGLKRPSGTFTSYKSLLRTSGCVEIRDGLWYATREGMRRAGAGIARAPRTTDEVLALWMPKLRGKSSEMMLHLLKKRGGWVPYGDLAGAVGLVQPSGTFTSYLSLLRTTGLITTDKGAARANKDALFL